MHRPTACHLVLLCLTVLATVAAAGEPAGIASLKLGADTSALRLLPTSGDLFPSADADTELVFNARQGLRWMQSLREALSLAGIPNRVEWQTLLPELDEDSVSNDDRGTPRSELIDCLNEEDVWGDVMGWRDLVWDKHLGNFKAVGAWSYASKANQRPTVPITVTTTASVSRLPQLYAQCLSWEGPLSAVVYMPLLQDSATGDHLTAQNRALLRGAVQKVSQFVADMKTVPDACKPDVLLVYEVLSDDLSRRLLYPFNTMRNLARLQARTPLIAMIDVDLLISRSLYERLADPVRMADLRRKVQKEKKVFIIPALDVHGGHEKAAWAQALVTADKELLVASMRKNVTFQFASEKYPPGHNLTDFPRWQTAKDDYDVEWETLCEPWIIGDRLTLPWADARYRGYGFDKVQLIAHVAASGFTFRVLNDAWIIHRAHSQNEARARFLKYKKADAGEPTLFTHNMGLWENQTKLHEEHKPFSPALHRSTRYCMAQLSWYTPDRSVGGAGRVRSGRKPQGTRPRAVREQDSARRRRTWRRWLAQ